jgi:hypothetical protein
LTAAELEHSVASSDQAQGHGLSSVLVEQNGAMRSANTWFLVLTTACIVGPYLFGVRPTTRQDWFLIAVTIAFLAWVLPLMASLRAV